MPVPHFTCSHDEVVGVLDASVLPKADITSSAREHDDRCFWLDRRTENGSDISACAERYPYHTFIHARIYAIGSRLRCRLVVGISPTLQGCAEDQYDYRVG
ncbi:hypothetical protein [Acetobacter senegalensis]|uniref:hypothetical protein n=1 Tax=Acetobacter senegalensis TaxID=446692 RepID=UPI0018D3E485|nr:hypothetical protein [Acetobacter senegalensis]